MRQTYTVGNLPTTGVRSAKLLEILTSGTGEINGTRRAWQRDRGEKPAGDGYSHPTPIPIPKSKS